MVGVLEMVAEDELVVPVGECLRVAATPGSSAPDRAG
jgi:hypothetical protein